MVLNRIDFTADYAIFLIGMFLLATIVAVFLERASPSRKSRRRIDQKNNRGDQAGELID